ncbi:MAG TPA: TlpA disulfide reductase family protein [Candidatus Limnocylindria bacterium]|nr:TlpA disulfide reductase family protein [Candidatus Limnocylindria bacterium]
MKKSSLALAGVLVLVFTGALFLYLNTHRGKPDDGEGARDRFLPQEGSAAPAFSLRDVSGNVVDSSHFLGKPTAINFFATWCPPCVDEIPGFVDVYNKYKDRGFELVGISLDTDTRENLPAFVMTHRIEYRILLGDLATTRAYGGVSSLPTTIFVGKDGRIQYVHVGYLDRDTFDSEVRKLL